MRLVALLGLLVTFASSSFQTVAAAAEPQGAASADRPADTKTVLKALAAFYRQKKSFEVDFDQKVSMNLNGLKNTIESQAKITAERPNRFAIRPKDAAFGVTAVSDGKQLSISLVNQYSQTAAPASFDELLRTPFIMGGVGGRGPLVDVFADDPYETLMEGVTKEEYAGLAKIGGAEAHHLKFQQDEFDWELWVATGDQPLVLQVAFDMKKSLVAGFDDEQRKDTEFSLIQQYKNWRFDKPLGADAFVFRPPQGAKKVDSLFGGGDEDEAEVSPLIGEPAPDIEQEFLDGGHFSLKEQKGKKIVILEFWETSSGPCIREMPLVAKVADEYREKGVALYCVNQGEDSDTIREFLEEKKLKVTVSLDPESQSGEAYGVEDIPLLVLIDKTGVVQSVHAGFSPEIGGTLKKELDAVIAGKDLASDAQQAREAEDAALPTEGLEKHWSKSGSYTGVAVAADGKTIVAVQRQTADFFSASGEKDRSVTLAAPGAMVRCARLSGQEPGELLVFNVWAQGLTAIDGEGNKLWSPSRGQGIDDVWAADLDGDGRDEVIVGYNGATGLHVFDGKGDERWADTSIGNVWHVTAGDLDGDRALEVITTSADGKVHVFDAKGEELKTLDPGIYANMVRPFRLPGDSADSALVVGGGIDKVQLVALSGSGDVLWEADLPDNVRHCDSLEFAPGTTWAAVGCRGGLVCVLDVRTGEMIAAASHQGMTPQVAWAATDGKPLLVASTGKALNAWRVKPKDTAESK